MSRFIRKLFTRVLAGGVCLLPLGTPVEIFAQPKPDQSAPVPAASTMTAKELHQHLARGAGWIRIIDSTGVRHGTGWILDLEQKLMVTNHHVVDGVDEVVVTFPIWKDGKVVTSEAAYQNAPKVKAVVIDRDANRDLAVIRVESIPDGMHALKLADAEPDEGDEIRLIGGFTNGGDGLVWGSVSGVVRACGPQTLDTNKRRRAVPVREVLSSAPTNGGNSGAPVVNSAGEVVAVHFAFKPWATGVVRHVSIVELKAYLKIALPMVEPKTADEFLARAKRRFDAGRTDAAAADASAALSKNPKLAEALAIRGQAFLAKNDPQTALEDFNAALKLAPENYDFNVYRGRAHRAAGKTAEAISDFSAAVRINPELWVAYNERGLTHFRTNNFADAADDFGRAIDAAPKMAVLWGNRADARTRLEKFDLAAADWAKAAELAPGDAYYSNGQGLALLKARKYDTAAEAFAVAVTASNGAPLYLGNMAEALRLAGKHDVAVKAFTKAIDAWQKLVADGVKIAPVKIANEYAARGMARIALKQFKDAADDLSKALELTDRKVAWYFAERAAALDGLGEKAAADADRKSAEALGYKFAKPVQAKLEDAFVGTWTGTCMVNGVRLTQVITFHANGTFIVTATARNAAGSELVTDTGTWSVTKAKLTINGKAFGTVNRTYELSGGEMKVVVEELGGITITFTKSK